MNRKETEKLNKKKNKEAHFANILKILRISSLQSSWMR